MPSSRRNTKKRIQESPAEKEFWEFARKHFAEDFPNPTRQGCPPEKAIRFLTETPLADDESVLEHLFHCSPCYQLFYDLMHKMKAQQKSVRKKFPSSQKQPK